MTPTIDIGKTLTAAYNLYKDNITTLLLATLLGSIIGGFTLGILAGPMLAGLALITLALIDKAQPKPDIGDVFKGFNFFVPALIYFIVYLVALLVGNFILGLLPLLGLFLPTLYGMALSTFTMFTIFNIVDRKMDVVPAIQASVDLVKANFWIFLGLNIVAAVVGGLGAVACLVGVVVTAPMYLTTVAIAYRELYPAGGSASQA